MTVLINSEVALEVTLHLRRSTNILFLHYITLLVVAFQCLVIIIIMEKTEAGLRCLCI